MGQITIGFSTREDNPKFIEQIIKTCGVDVDIIQKINNGEKSLSKVYNEILEEAKTDIIVLCHIPKAEYTLFYIVDVSK